MTNPLGLESFEIKKGGFFFVLSVISYVNCLNVTSLLNINVHTFLQIFFVVIKKIRFDLLSKKISKVKS